MTNDYSRLKALPKQFPRVFSGDSTRSFEHGVGWTDLVAQLISEIDAMLHSEPH